MPVGFKLESKIAPSVQAINRLLARCNLETHSPKRLALALEKSDCFLSLVEEKSCNLYGFVRVTSDKGLNANLWDLSAEPGQLQEVMISILIHRILKMIKQDIPGCSISVAASSIAVKGLQEQGFLLDPSGIKAMDFRI